MIAPDDEMAGAVPAISLAAYEAIPAAKKLIELEGGHFGLLYYPSELFDRYALAQREFLCDVML
jgi:hypothetical protein